MKKLLLILTSILILSVSLFGQAVYTTVTATLTDSSTQVWSNATIIATLRPAPNNPAVPLNNGQSITDSPQTAITDNTGTFTLNLDSTNKITPAGALWIFTIYPNSTVANGSSISLPVTGATENLSGVLSSILIVPNVYAAPVISRAYSQSEVSSGTGGIYWDTSANTLKGCYTTGNGSCVWTAIGNYSIPGSHYYIPFNNGVGGFAASVNLQFNNTNNTFTTYNGSFTNNLGVLGATSLNSTLSVGQDTSLGSTLEVTGLATLGGGLDLTGISDGCLYISFTVVSSVSCLVGPEGLGGTPTLAPEPGAGTSPTITLSNGSLDKVGVINVTTGTAPATYSPIVGLTFSTPFPTFAACTIGWRIGSPYFGTAQVPIDIGSDRFGLSIGSGYGSALAANTAYSWSYLCQGY